MVVVLVTWRVPAGQTQVLSVLMMKVVSMHWHTEAPVEEVPTVKLLTQVVHTLVVWQSWQLATLHPTQAPEN